MPRDVENLHFRPQKIRRRRLLNQKVPLERLNLQLKTPFPEKIGVSNHGSSFRVKAGLASMLPDNRSRIGHMVKMAMGEEQKIDFFVLKGPGCTLRGVKEDVSAGGPVEKAVGIEGAAGK